MLTRRSRRKSRSYILFDESRMLRNERALFQTWLFKTPRYFLETFSFLPGFTIAQTKSQFNPKIVTSPKFCILPKFIYLFLYILPLFIIVNGFYLSATLCSDIIPHIHRKIIPFLISFILPPLSSQGSADLLFSMADSLGSVLSPILEIEIQACDQDDCTNAQ